jgi:hypothetical protein
MTDVRNMVKLAYQEECLSPERLDAIMADTRAVARHQYTQVLGYTAMAAGIAVFVYFGLFFYKKSTITDTLLQEIAANYTSHLDSEIKSTNYDSLSRMMSKVHFQIKPDDEPVDHFYQVRGARYGTIGGELVAQVELLNKIRRQQQTLYAAQLNENLNSIDNDYYQRNGVGIKVWKNNNMFYAIAHTVSSR